MKHLKKQRERLKARQKDFDDMRADHRQGRVRPGSMNRHKSHSIKKRRKS